MQINPHDERFIPLLLPLLTGALIATPFAYHAGKNSCYGPQCSPYYQQMNYYPQPLPPPVPFPVPYPQPYPQPSYPQVMPFGYPQANFPPQYK